MYDDDILTDGTAIQDHPNNMDVDDEIVELFLYSEPEEWDEDYEDEEDEEDDYDYDYDPDYDPDWDEDDWDDDWDD